MAEFVMTYKIRIGDYYLQLLDSTTIKKSVETLADTAVIVIPGTYINAALQIEDKIKEGDPVEIWLAYNGKGNLEFQGFLNSISTDDGDITLDCEDALYLFKIPVKDAEMKNISLKSLLEKVVSVVDVKISISCNYSFTWDKFVFYKATAFDVLKKIQDETKANIYFSGNVLHVHPPYSEITNSAPVIYDFTENIEKSSLKYVLFKNKKIEVQVNATDANGKRKTHVFGIPGGRKEIVELGSANDASMKQRAEQQYNLFAYDGYEGGFTGWLIPYVEPGYKIRIKDADYTDKEGVYFVVATDTKFSSSGAERTVTIGKKLD